MENKNTKVSIILPVHNGQKYLEEAINSCLIQTYPNLELIVIDDESTDNSSVIAKRKAIEDNRIKVITIRKQKNLGSVLNFGIKIAQGEYIARMDADDIMIQNRLELQTKFLDENPNVVVVGGRIEIIDENGKTKNKRSYPLNDKELKKNMFLFQPFAHPAIMIRKEILNKIGNYPEDIDKVEDTKLMFLLSKEGEFANIKEIVLKYRVTYNTQSQSDIYTHFKKTEEVRNWAIQYLKIIPTNREKILWNIEKIGMNILRFFPKNIVFNIFEILRNIINK